MGVLFHRFWVVAIVGVTILSGCGGGGGTGSTTNVSPGSAVLTAEQAASATAAVSTNGLTELTLPADLKLQQGDTTVLASSLVAGSHLLLPPGLDPRFPLGIAGRVSSLTNAGQTTTVNLDAAMLSDIASASISAPGNSMPLTAENFVGVINPGAVKASAASLNRSIFSAMGAEKSVLGGGVRVRGPSFARRAARALGASDIDPGGSVDLNLEVLAREMVDDSSSLKPYGKSGEAKFVITGALNNLVLVPEHDFSLLAGGLKSMNLKVSGDLSIEAKLEGGVQAQLGYFNQAWKEVEDAEFDVLGMSGKLSGLSSKDKLGKYPLVGLVFAPTCPQTCQFGLGSAQTPLRLAKMGGVVIWVYIAQDGTITLDGAAGVRVNGAKFEAGLVKPEGGELSGVGSLAPNSDKNLLEVPFVQGEIGASVTNGVAVDADLFIGGVRVATAGIFAGGRTEMSLKLSDGEEWSYSTKDLTSDWELTALNVCFTQSNSAGAYTAFESHIGVEAGKASIDLSYSDQYPSKADRALEGWHGTWYKWPMTKACFPTPTVEGFSAQVVSGALTADVSGSGLPQDLVLTTDDGLCSGLKKIESSGSHSQWACTVNSSAQPATINFQLSSEAAANMDQSAVSDKLFWKPSTGLAVINVSNVEPSVGETVLIWLTKAWSEISEVVFTFSSGVSQLVSKVAGGISDQLSQIFSASGDVTVTATYKDSSGQTLGSDTTRLNVSGTTGISGVSPAQTIRTFGTSFAISGSNLPTSGVTVSSSADPRVSCQVPTNLTANGFDVGCTLYKMGNVPLDVYANGGLIGSVTVAVRSNVTGVTWARGDSDIYGTGTVYFNETITYKVVGENLLDDPVMGFAVDECGVANTEVGIPTSTARYFTCFFNDQAGATPGQKAGVVKDARGGQVLLDGWSVPVAVSPSSGKLPHTGITESQCFMAGSDILVSCASPAAIALSGEDKQDGMYSDVNPKSYSRVGSFGLDDCVKDNVTGLMWEGKAANGTRAGGNRHTNWGDGRSGDASAYVAAVNATGLCGYTDWRLPTVDELETLVEASKPAPGPTIRLDWFVNSAGDGYWSSSPLAGSIDYAWIVDFYGGSVYTDLRLRSVAVRLVRASQ